MNAKPDLTVALRYTLYAWLAVLLLRNAALGGEYAPISGFTWVVIVVWLAMFTLGAVFFATSAQSPALSSTPIRQSEALQDRWLIGLSVVAIIGAAMVTYEFAVLRSYGFATAVALIRTTEAARASTEGLGTSPLGGIGRMLTHSLHPAWILFAISDKPIRRRSLSILLFASVLVLWYQMMFEGGRIFLTCIVLSVWLGWSLRKSSAENSKTRRLSSTGKFVSACVLVVVLVTFGYAFIERYDSFDVVELTRAYQTFTSQMPIFLSQEVLDKLQGSFEQFWFAVYMLWIYVTAGINEFDLLMKFPDTKPGFGMVQFSQMGQIITRVTGVDVNYDVFANMPNPGVYTTLIGPSYMDFGIYVSWVIAPFLGYFAAACARNYQLGTVNALSLAAPFVLLICIFSPVVSLTVSLWPSIAWAFFAGRAISQVNRRARVYPNTLQMGQNG